MRWWAVVLPLLLSGARCDPWTEEDERDCGRPLLTGDRGFVASHPGLGRRPYPGNRSCEWRVRAPPGGRLLLLAPTFALEAEPRCRFDALEVEEGGRALARLCGPGDADYFVSAGPWLTLRFRADASVAKAGFILRYVFLDGDWPPPGRLDRDSARRACEPGLEFRCRAGPCLPTQLRCDRLPDCPDASDEEDCPRAPNRCRHDEFACSAGPCVPFSHKCDRRRDCPDASDERFCGPGAAVPVPAALPMPGAPCGRKPIAHRAFSRVVGGQVATPGSWPWMASLRWDRKHACGGAVVAPRWILTAAHCLAGYGLARGWQVHAGRFAQRGEGRPGNVQVRQARRLVPHPRYRGADYDFDFALVRVARPLAWTSFVLPLCLPDAPGALAEGSFCVVAGWGRTLGTGGAGLLKQGLVQVLPAERCRRRSGRGLSPRMVCAGRPKGGIDTCQGDSGGPLMCETAPDRWTAAGVTSYGGICGQKDSPGVYARVAEVRDWLRAVVAADP